MKDLSQEVPRSNHREKGSDISSNCDVPSRWGPLMIEWRQHIIDFEVYRTTFHTPGFREYHRRMQLFILLYIEAGSYINEDEDQWEFVVLYEKRRRRDGSFTYHFVGYSSLYNFYHFPEKFRLRLSQFVILSSYQRQSPRICAIFSHLSIHPISRPSRQKRLTDALCPHQVYARRIRWRWPIARWGASWRGR
ncbi:acyl-CoA N-acyltransferase [Guyanagaster necrorhizus]|uniref:Histone acetyltransferase type B catalytic subunit n=1 Tax=Guyanagaster necrorhizus TaxID=856835 RepID=A0A9P8AS89_9AGAR|nr:acyl-CoA N-acyltransferase [Guyanagaster necrorhizus MCA 3950]KAG7446148.1 acyl-CoA N-acyltransferase [Guyanagaster necrorhizus MCA 3950]